MTYLTNWEFYSSLFPSPEITEQEFTNTLPQAQAKLEVWTHSRILTETTAWKVKQIEQTLCFLINAIHDKSDNPIGVTSASNDGYSETYSGRSVAEEELRGVAVDGLSGTGLIGAL